MALFTCPECGKEISDKATMCPYCGYSSENANGKIKSYLKWSILEWLLIPLEITLVMILVVTSAMSDKGIEILLWISFALNTVLAVILTVKCGKSVNAAATKSKKKPVKNIIAMVLAIGFLFFNTTIIYRNSFGKEESIVGEWKSSAEGLDMYFVYEADGDFYSYAELDGYDAKVPGGEGTYICEDGVVKTTMSNGNVTESEYTVNGDTMDLNGMTWERVG